MLIASIVRVTVTLMMKYRNFRNVSKLLPDYMAQTTYKTVNFTLPS